MTSTATILRSAEPKPVSLRARRLAQLSVGSRRRKAQRVKVRKAQRLARRKARA